MAFKVRFSFHFHSCGRGTFFRLSRDGHSSIPFFRVVDAEPEILRPENPRVSGLPSAVKRLRVVRSGSGEGFHDAGTVTVIKGETALDLPGWSLVSLTTMPPR